MADQAFQVRSISLPSRSHPATGRLKEEMQRLKSCTPSSTSASTAEPVCDRMRKLRDVYDEIDELLRLPGNQQSMTHPNQRKWMEDELEISLRLLDLSGAVRDGLVAEREHLENLQIAFRSKNKIVHHSIHSDTVRSINKNISASFKSLSKQINSISHKISTSTADSDILPVITASMEASENAISVLQSASSFLATPITKAKATTSKWSIISKALQRKKVACEGQHKDESKEESITACSRKLQDLEKELESLFRRLIQNRVSLLNVLSF